MPKRTVVEIPQEAHAQRLAALRRARYGYVLALHLVLLCAAGRNPTDLAAVLFCSRSSVYRMVRAYRAGPLGLEPAADGRLSPPVRTTVLVPTLRRSLRALLKAPPRAFGWCRTRWSCATLAATLQTKRGMTVSAETRRRWVHEVDWVWKRAKLVAKDDDLQRVDRLARIRVVYAQLRLCEALVCADEREIHLLPKVGYAGMPKGSQLEVRTPGQHQKDYLAGALDLPTGTLPHGVGPRKTNALCRNLLTQLDARYPADRYTQRYVVVAHYTIHQAKAVAQWLATHPRVTLLWLPTYCPRANPIARAFGDVHDGCTRNHQRKRLPELVAEVEDHGHLNGPWQYKLSDLYYEAAVTAAVEKIATEEHATAAACVYQSHVDRFSRKGRPPSGAVWRGGVPRLVPGGGGSPGVGPATKGLDQPASKGPRARSGLFSLMGYSRLSTEAAKPPARADPKHRRITPSRPENTPTGAVRLGSAAPAWAGATSEWCPRPWMPHILHRHTHMQYWVTCGRGCWGISVVKAKSTRSLSSRPPHVGHASSVTLTSTGGSVIASGGGAPR